MMAGRGMKYVASRVNRLARNMSVIFTDAVVVLVWEEINY
jgi:hypothetical protein